MSGTPAPRHSARCGVLAALAAAAVFAACAEDRPRPAPPLLSIFFDSTTVHSPGQLTGIVQAQDPDGIDSVWLVVDADTGGDNGGFNELYEAPFQFTIDSGHTPGFRVPIKFWARDVVGFVDTLDTTVVVVR